MYCSQNKLTLMENIGIYFSVYRCHQVYNTEDPDSIADNNLFQVNITPDYFHDVLKLKDTWLAFSIISGIFTLIILLIFIALRQQISLAIELINQGKLIFFEKRRSYKLLGSINDLRISSKYEIIFQNST